MLQAAVFTDRRVRLGYRSSGRPRGPEASGERGQSTERVVDPYGLVCMAAEITGLYSNVRLG